MISCTFWRKLSNSPKLPCGFKLVCITFYFWINSQEFLEVKKNVLMNWQQFWYLKIRIIHKLALFFFYTGLQYDIWLFAASYKDKMHVSNSGNFVIWGSSLKTSVVKFDSINGFIKITKAVWAGIEFHFSQCSLVSSPWSLSKSENKVLTIWASVFSFSCFNSAPCSQMDRSH